MVPLDERIKVLFVTDEEYWHKLRQSKDLGDEYDLELALDDDRAKHKMDLTNYDAVVSDASIMDNDPIGMLKKMRTAGKRLPFILLIGKGDEEVAVEALENGASFYLAKTDDARLHFAELASMIYRSVIQSKLEVKLRKQQADLLAIFENSPTMIALVNQDIEVMMVNGAMAEFIGDGPETIVGQRLGGAVHCVHSYENPEGCGHGRFCKLCPIRMALDNTFLTGIGVKNAEVVQEERRKDTWVKKNLRVTSSLLDILGQKMVAVYIEDVTEQKRMQNAVLMANKKLNLLGTVTRHDVVNQLAVLMGNLEIAIMKDPKSTLIKYMRKAMESGENISTILSFSKDYERMGTEVPTWVNVRESCLKGVATVQHEGVELHIETGSLELLADRMLEKVFLNLMDNALRHGEHARNIWVRSKEDGEGMQLTFSDDGVGIPENEKGKIFELGFGKHTGLGLYLVREILEITGITIVENGQEGSGACFMMRVPFGAYRHDENDIKVLTQNRLIST